MEYPKFELVGKTIKRVNGTNTYYDLNMGDMTEPNEVTITFTDGTYLRIFAEDCIPDSYLRFWNPDYEMEWKGGELV